MTVLRHPTDLVVALGNLVQAGFRGIVKKRVARGPPLGVGIQRRIVDQNGVVMIQQGLHHGVQHHHHCGLEGGI